METARDISLVAVKNALVSGKWHDNPILEPYRRFQNELTDHEGIILRETRIVLPKSLQRRALQIAYEGHLSVEKCKGLLRQKVYWITMKSVIESHIEKCLECQTNSRMPDPEPIKTSILPEHVWDELAMDLFGSLPSEEYLFAIEDIYSRYPFVDIMKIATAPSIKNKLERLLAIFGYPYKIRSDNGPPFQSEALKLYFENADIKHIKITPRYPQAKVIVERFIQVIAKTIKTTHFMGKNWREELQCMLRNYRCAPHAITGKPPATLLFNRNIKNKFPSIIVEKSPCDKEVRGSQNKKYAKVKK